MRNFSTMSKPAAMLLLTTAAISGLRAQDWAPTEQPLTRYEHIWKSSPFVSASEPVQQSESLTNRMVLTGFAKINGSDVAFLFDRTDLRRFTITKGSPVKGVELVSVDNRGRLKDSTVRIKIGSDVGDIKYDASSAAGTGGGGGGNEVVPVAPTVSASSLPVLPSPSQTQNAGSSANAATAEGQRPKIVPKRFVRRLAAPAQ